MPGSNERDRGYWRDVGTIGLLRRPHGPGLAAAGVQPLQHQWPIYTSHGPHPPAKFVEGTPASVATYNSILSPGVVVTGGAVNSRCSRPPCYVESGAPRSPTRCCCTTCASAGRGGPQRDHRQERRGPARRQIGVDPTRTEARGFVVEDGLTVLAKDQEVPKPMTRLCADRAGTPARARGPRRRRHTWSPPTTPASRPRQRRPAGRFGTSGHRGTSLKTLVQRDPHPRDHPGDLRLPRASRATTARCSSARHPWALRARVGLGAGGAGRQRRDRAGRRPGRLHAHAGGLARDPPRQPRKDRRRARGLADGIVVTPSHNPPDRRRASSTTRRTAAPPTPT